MAFRQHETSLHRLQRNCILRRREGRLWVLRAISYLNHQLSDIVQVDFFDSWCVENVFVWPIDPLKHRSMDFDKVVFWDVQKLDYEFSKPFAHLNQHLSDFVQVTLIEATMQKMSSYGLSTPWNIASSNTKVVYKTSRTEIDFSRPFACFKHYLSDSAQVALFELHDAERRVRIAFRHIETSLHRLHKFVF
jgi:hypothetical protein